MLLNVAIVANLALFLGFASAAHPSPRDQKKHDWIGYAKLFNKVDWSVSPVDKRRLDAAKKVADNAISKFSARHEEFITTLNENGATTLFVLASGAKSLKEYRQGKSGSADKFKSQVGDRLTRKELENMDVDVCSVFTEALEAIKERSYIPSACYNKFLKNLELGLPYPGVLSGLPEKWAQDVGPEVASALMGYLNTRADGIPWLIRLSSAFWQAAVKSKNEKVYDKNEFCAKFHPKYLNNLQDTQRKAIGAPCMGSFRRLRNVDIKSLEDYNDNIFSFYNGKLHKDTAGRISGPQLAAFASQFGDDRCQYLNIADVNVNSMPMMSPGCFEGYVAHNTTPIGKGLQLVPLAAYTWKDRQNLGSFHEDDWRHFNSDVLNSILKNPEALSKLPKTTEKYGLLNSDAVSKLQMNKTELKALADASPSLASQIIMQGDIKNDALALFDKDLINSMFLVEADGLVVGFEFFKVLANKRRGRELIQHMGDEADTHWCSTIDSIRAYLDLPWLRSNLSDKCRNELPFRSEPDAVQQAPELGKKNAELIEAVIREYDARAWSEVDAPFMGILVNDSKNGLCKAMASPDHKEILENLSDAALAMINADCAVHMKAVITPALAPKLAPNAFALMKHADMVSMKVSPNDLTVAQIPFISAFLPEAEVSQHYFALVQVATIKDLSKDRFAAISSKQWGLVPREVVTFVFTASKIPALPNAMLSYITDAQMEFMDKDALNAFSAEQLLELGRAVEAELKAFETIKEKLDPARAHAIQARQDALAAAKAARANTPAAKPSKPEEPAAESGSNTLWYIVASVVAVVIIGGVVFIIVRRN